MLNHTHVEEPFDDYTRQPLLPRKLSQLGPGVTWADVDWVAASAAANRLVARARGAGANVVNAELPAGWSATRTRPLCAYPKTARYLGSGSPDAAASFRCE